MGIVRFTGLVCIWCIALGFCSCNKKTATAAKGSEYYYLTGPAKMQVLEQMSQGEIAQRNDSLFALLDAGDEYVPGDLDSTILVVQLYDKYDFAMINAVRFSRLEGRALERSFKIYDKKKDKLMRKYPHELVYAYEESLDSLDVNPYRYVLKTATRLAPYETEKLMVRNDGEVSGWHAYTVYYVYDRRDKKHFRQLYTHKLLFR